MVAAAVAAVMAVVTVVDFSLYLSVGEHFLTSISGPCRARESSVSPASWIERSAGRPHFALSFHFRSDVEASDVVTLFCYSAASPAAVVAASRSARQMAALSNVMKTREPIRVSRGPWPLF